MRIYKYTLKDYYKQNIEVHPIERILDARMQNGVVVFWATVRDEEPTVAKTFFMLETGDKIPDDCGNYIATLQARHDYVIHIFERKE